MSCPIHGTRKGSTYGMTTDAVASSEPMGAKVGQAGPWIPPLRYYIKNRDAIARQSRQCLLGLLKRTLDRLEELGEAKARPASSAHRH